MRMEKYVTSAVILCCAHFVRSRATPSQMISEAMREAGDSPKRDGLEVSKRLLEASALVREGTDLSIPKQEPNLSGFSC